MWSIYEIIHIWTSIVDESDEWSSTRYLTGERSERIRYKGEHETKYSISKGSYVFSCDLSDYFPKILPKFSEGHTKVSEHFPKISEVVWW